MPVDLITELHSGRKIIIPQFNQAAPSPQFQPGDPALFSFVLPRHYNLDLTPGQINNLRQPVDGSVHAGVPTPPLPGAARPGNPPVKLPFKWLPFVAGSITYTALDNTLPILTGLMTGCWLSTFQLRGQTYLGHIGTDSNSTANTLDVKSAWKIAEKNLAKPGNNPGPRILGIQSPFRAFRPSDHVVSTVAMFGAVNARGDLYAISFDVGGGNTHTVKQVRHVAAPSPGPVFT